MLRTIVSVVGRSNRVAARLAGAHVEGNMTAVVKITRGGDAEPKWNPVTKKVSVEPGDEIWGPGVTDPRGRPGCARIRAVSGPVTMALGDEPQYFQSTYIGIPLRARQPQTDDIVEVISAPDPNLVGRHYRVVDVSGGGQIPVEHSMQVVGIQPGRTWRPPA